MAHAAGLDGVVASPREASRIRSATAPDFLIVTPGVRPSGAAMDDQKRITTPRDAILTGADFIVVGRPSLKQSIQFKAALQIIEEMDAASVKTAS